MKAAARRSTAAPPRTRAAGGDAFTVTHASRVIDPSTGFTKLDLARYYATVARWALPHLRGRHAFIRRAPEGLKRPSFFQEHPEGLPGLKGTDPALWPGHAPAITFETAEDLVAAVQLGMIEIHTWNSTAAAVLQPDRLVFDVDPGENVAWDQVRQAAMLTRTLLGELGLRSWVKTTGGKGLHVVVPIVPEADFPAAKAFCRRAVEHLARTLPQLFVAKSGPRNRVGRVFVDYLRNGQSQTTAAAFSARARPGLSVSMPVRWEELDRVSGPGEWNIVSALERLAGLKQDPWASFWKTRQSLLPAARALG
ncbi:hypothetical protein EZ313_21240 [Ramlibacter henchirensis]|uniref:DNA ligase D polymerase domain-containing protein n=1 Tax=Ramlibacter henchirensis TaxID=204072 RepID=A0A4Z0BSI0_9BURK|nr:non-homologous end-joining DNA ligase [Ramlibacter henchirensis]TFZ00959.1 hypothetical protein EZ313_21240 [Ramlibacter henchirensis]